MKILVVGDIMLDVTHYGSIKRFSPEAPVPVLEVEKSITTLGGAGNVAMNLCKLLPDADIHLYGNYDQVMVQALVSLPANLHLDGKARRGEFGLLEMIQKKRYIDNSSGYHLLRIDNDYSIMQGKLNQLDWARFNHKYQEKQFDAVIVSDYCKGTIEEKSPVFEIVRQMHKNDQCNIYLDTKNTSLSFLSTDQCLLDYWKPNKGELDKVLSFYHCDKQQLIAKFHLKGILTTLGRDGMIMTTADEEMAVQSQASNVIDVCGAGDTSLAGFVVSMLNGYDCFDSMQVANILAADVCNQRGTALPRNEIKDVMDMVRNGMRSE